MNAIRTKQLEIDIKAAQKMAREGLSHLKIAKALRRSHGWVCKYTSTIRKDYRKAQAAESQ